MIRKGIYILCTSLALGCCACNDWLTIVPETTLVADNLFETDNGVLQALDGAYVLAAESIYKPNGYMGGGGFAEYLACTWTNTNVDLAAHVYNLDNASFATGLDAVFMAFYKIINSLNPMIEGCDKNREKLSDEYYNIVKGEALALRASLHLDLIRIWGPMPTRVDASMEYLPYVTQNSIENYQYHTFKRFMELLVADLDEAEQLLQKSDPILNYPSDGSTEYTGSWTDRKSHFNYYGVLGLQARARLWMGDKEGAVRYAAMVKDAKNEDGTPKFTLAVEGNIGNNLFYPEPLCGVNQDKFDYQQSGFNPGITMLGYYNSNYNSFVNDLFEGNTNDLRYKSHWSWTRNQMRQNVRVTKKYNEMYPSSTAKRNMPVVRLAEMYLIIMEVGSLSEANVAYEEYSAARNLTYTPMSESDRQERVLWEYIREFAAEGQNFFTYKRFAVKRMLWQNSEAEDCGEEQYVLPLPPSEYKKR